MAAIRASLLFTAVKVLLHVSFCSGFYFDKRICNDKYDLRQCHHNQSDLCANGRSVPQMNCSKQLKDGSNGETKCLLEWIDPTTCHIERPSTMLGPEELPLNIQMYYYKSWIESRPVVNLTFPNPSWQYLKFEFRSTTSGENICRKFSLPGRTHSLTDTLMWDCIFTFDGPSFDISVVTDEGKGGKYSYRIPDEKRFDPTRTLLEDWQVFFFLHMDHFQQSAYLPVTIQLPPPRFKNLSYKVSLMKCLSPLKYHKKNDTCDQYSVLASLNVSSADAIVLGDIYRTKQKTVLLPLWSNPAVYMVGVQIVSPDCPAEGCFLSLSPPLEIKSSLLGLWIGIAIMLIVLFTSAYAITLHFCTKQNRNFLLSLDRNSPSVLLLYLPENRSCFDLVKTLAEFLKEKCYVRPYVIDSDVGSQNPNTWTSERMNTADRLLFIVPGNSDGESVTPIRDQWLYSLHYFSGQHFMKNSMDKVATVLLPFSGDVPRQISNVRRFALKDELPSLVTWIHDGSWLDNKLIWGPQIKSSPKNSPSLPKLMQAIDRATQETKSHDGITNYPNHERYHSNIQSEDCNIPRTLNGTGEDDVCCKSFDSLDTASVDGFGKEFDPNIADVNDLLLDKSGAGVEDDSDSSSEASCDIDPSYFM